jgi:hypothetical protein
MGWGARYSSTIQNGYRTKTKENTHTHNNNNNQHERRPPDSPAALPPLHHGQGRLAPKSSRRFSPTSGCRSRAVGIALPDASSFVWGVRMAPIENERGGRRIDLDGRRLLFKHNNQIKAGVCSGGCVREEMRTGGTRGGWRSLDCAAFKLNDEKIRKRGGCLDLNGRCSF